MQLNDGIRARGLVEVEIIRDTAHGPRVLQRRRSRNTVVNVGKKQTWRQACGLNTNDWDQLRIGTSGATVASNQTNLLSVITGTLTTADSKTMSGRTFQLVVSYPSGTTTTSKSATGIDEVAILNQNTSPGGSMLARALFTAVNKTRDDKLKITYSVRIT